MRELPIQIDWRNRRCGQTARPDRLAKCGSRGHRSTSIARRPGSYHDLRLFIRLAL
jgi:hypothetical protein